MFAARPDIFRIFDLFISSSCCCADNVVRLDTESSGIHFFPLNNLVVFSAAAPAASPSVLFHLELLFCESLLLSAPL